jgi:hypothetical protein
MTRPIITALLLVTLTLFVGCGKDERGPAYGQKQEFQRQIADSVPVKNWGYTISDIRLSDDAQKVLVVFDLPGGTNREELVLQNDGFRRYTGTFSSKERFTAEILAYDAVSAAYTSNLFTHVRTLASLQKGAPPGFRPDSSASIVVTLPDR